MGKIQDYQELRQAVAAIQSALRVAKRWNDELASLGKLPVAVRKRITIGETAHSASETYVDMRTQLPRLEAELEGMRADLVPIYDAVGYLGEALDAIHEATRTVGQFERVVKTLQVYSQLHNTVLEYAEELPPQVLKAARLLTVLSGIKWEAILAELKKAEEAMPTLKGRRNGDAFLHAIDSNWSAVLQDTYDEEDEDEEDEYEDEDEDEDEEIVDDEDEDEDEDDGDEEDDDDYEGAGPRPLPSKPRPMKTKREVVRDKEEEDDGRTPPIRKGLDTAAEDTDMWADDDLEGGDSIDEGWADEPEKPRSRSKLRWSSRTPR